MAKRKPLFGVSNYTKKTPKKRPGVHTKRLNKRKPHRKKNHKEFDETLLRASSASMRTAPRTANIGDFKYSSQRV